MSIVVLGSLFMDIAATAPRRPSPGETVIGTDLVIAPGGKGFNQAAAVAAAGASVELISRIGDDLFGRDLLRACAEARVGTTHVTVDASEGTGVGLPVLDADGENAIVVVPRAASTLSGRDAVDATRAIAQADMLLLQLEVPVAATTAAAAIACEAGVPVLLNAAPADAIPAELLALTDHLVVNQHEAALLLGRPALDLPVHDAAGIAQHFVEVFGVRTATITLGADGAAFAGENTAGVVPGHRVQVVDTVGAGDAFCGFLAADLADGVSLPDAVGSANAAGALTATRPGAQPSIPDRDAVTRLAGTGRASSSFTLEGKNR